MQSNAVKHTMKIFHVTDLHFNQVWFEFIKDKQNEFDVLCISGDLLDAYGGKVDLYTQIKLTTAWLKSFTKPLFVCSGNHDIALSYDENWLSEIEGIYADNCVKNINGVKFGCLPYFYTDANFVKFAPCDVLLAHVPPAKTLTATTKNDKDLGNVDLYRAIAQNFLHPKVMLCGHIHDPKEQIYKLKDTMIYNPGCDKKSIEPRYCIIEI